MEGSKRDRSRCHRRAIVLSVCILSFRIIKLPKDQIFSSYEVSCNYLECLATLLNPHSAPLPPTRCGYSLFLFHPRGTKAA